MRQLVMYASRCTGTDGLRGVPIVAFESVQGAFVKGRDWIRVPAIFYAGMITQATIVYLCVGLLGDAPLFNRVCDGACAGYDYRFTNVPLGLAYNVPYIVVALLLVARVWRPHPFSRPTAGATN